jgi:hypothetical protein
MATTYTDLGLSLMLTGENSGTWGDITNKNLQLIQQGFAGYEEVSIAGGVQTTPLPITDATLSSGRNAVIKFTGTITGNQTVTILDGIEKIYIIENGTVGVFTVEFKTLSGTGVTFSATDKGQKFVYSNGTNIIDIALGVPGGSDTQVQFNSGGTAFGGSANFIWDGTNLVLDAEGALRLGDSAGSGYVGLKAPATISGDTPYTLTLPVATGTADQILVTDGSGNLSFADVAGGASWQAVITADPANAVAGNGYFCNTTGGAFTVTLPTSAAIGDFISFIDYAGTFDTYNLTIGRNGHNIQGAAADLTVSVERAGFTLIFVDATQGWLLGNK